MNTAKFVSMVASAALIASTGVALAQVDVSAGAGASVNAGGATAQVDATIEARITKAKDRADKEIQRRIDMLNALNTRVQAMAHISADEKTSISGLVSTQVSSLTELKAKIAADSDLATLKADIQSIAQSYRIFMLVIPRARIDVAADKINTAAVALGALSVKLQDRITSASATSSASATAALSDMNTQTGNAKAAADAAVALVVNLQPDNGDKTVQTANTQALKDARAKIQEAIKAIQAARKDAHTIVQWLHSAGASANASASSSASMTQ